MADDAIRLDRSTSLDQTIAAITGLGIGRRTAQYLALRLGEPDGCPIAAGEVAERWRPWRALAVTHLWGASGTLPSGLEPSAPRGGQ